MREKRGRRANPKTLDPVADDDDETRGDVTGKDGKGFFACYILTSLSPRHKSHTYIGFTVNPRRRIRQHNGEIASGAYRTKKKRPWEMVLCIYGFPTNVSALQFEWAWQHPRESLAVREAAAAFKSFTGLASKIKLAYTMLNLPAWNSLNLTVNYFSTKYAHYGGLSPSLPLQMKVQVCAMDDLPCFTQVDTNSQLEDEESPGDSNEEEDEDGDGCSNQSQPKNPTTCSSLDEKELQDRDFEKAKAKVRETVLDDESGEDEASQSIDEVMQKEPEIVVHDRLANFSGFGLFDESVEDEVSHGTVRSMEAMERDCWRRSNPVSEVEVIDLMTPSPSCRAGSSSMKRRRVSEFIDLTRSPNFIEL
uniref:Structure-specific endonuclease subunit SLX1 homolog n=2 Tax=Noccaea caerulescens TaxID=107243 RepID=A0A1J3ENP1_NOCCA